MCAVIVSYRAGSLVRKCVKSVAQQVGSVIVVDNWSDELTLRELRELEAEDGISVIYNSANRGIAEALNQGVRLAMRSGFQWVLTLDDDSEATPGMVEKLLRGFVKAGQGVSIVAASPFDVNAGSFIANDPLGQEPDSVVEVRTAISSGSLFDVRVFEEVGFFDERLFLWYVDHDFCLRVKQKGLKICFCPGAVLLHREGAKEYRRFLRKRVVYDRYGKEARYFISRNAIHVIRRYPKAGFSKEILSRLLMDTAKVVLFDDERAAKIKFILMGLADGVRGKYGGLGRPIARPGAGA